MIEWSTAVVEKLLRVKVSEALLGWDDVRIGEAITADLPDRTHRDAATAGVLILRSHLQGRQWLEPRVADVFQQLRSDTTLSRR